MLNRRLLSLLRGNMLATLFFILVYPTSYALAQNETIDDSITTDTETTDTETTDTETTDVNPLSQGTATWRKANLGVQVDVVSGTAEESDFTIQVTSSNTDDSIA
jgi:hypothetical protein